MRSSAVVKSHICIEPFEWPVNMNLRGLEPIRLDPSHSCTQNALTVLPSTALITQTLQGKRIFHFYLKQSLTLQQLFKIFNFSIRLFFTYYSK